jgi:hypothetical protein
MSKFIDLKSHNKTVLPKDFKMNGIQKSPRISEISDGMLGFEFDGQYIVDPTMDETGRYPVDGQKYYNISKVDVSRMIKKNMPQIYKDYPEWKNK